MTAPLPVSRPMSAETVRDRLRERTKLAPSGCIEWQGRLNTSGYGVLSAGGRTERAHRWAYLLEHGEVPAGMHVLHRCDNRRCCNPDHLYAGTNSENVADRMARGRHVSLYGNRNGKTRLTDEQIAAVVAERAAGVPPREVAERYGICDSYVRMLCRGARRQQVTA